MSRIVRWFIPVLALGLAIAFTQVTRAADKDSAKATGSVSGTVIGADGKPAANMKVRIVKPPMMDADKGEKPAPAPAAADEGGKGAGKRHRPEPIATGNTDSDGKFKI